MSPSRRRNLFQPNGPFPWSWSSGLPTSLVPAPVWCCCLPASHSICPLHTHTLQLSWNQWLPGKVRWTRVGLSLASYLAPTSDSLAMRSEKSLCVNCQMGSMGMVLHAVGLCPSGALEQRSQRLPQPGPTLWHLPTRLTFRSRNQRSTLGLINPLTPLIG